MSENTAATGRVEAASGWRVMAMAPRRWPVRRDAVVVGEDAPCPYAIATTA